MDWKLELIVVPVSDVDRAKTFYTDKVSFNLDVDHRAGDEFRVVQMTPPGSACSITIGTGMPLAAAPGSYQGLHLVVSDIDAARAHLVERGVDASELFHFGAEGQTPGPPRTRELRHVPVLQRPRRQWLAGAGGQARGAGGMTEAAAHGSRAAGGDDDESDEVGTAGRRDLRGVHDRPPRGVRQSGTHPRCLREGRGRDGSRPRTVRAHGARRLISLVRSALGDGFEAQRTLGRGLSLPAGTELLQDPLAARQPR